jgi:cell division protein ZapA
MPMVEVTVNGRRHAVQCGVGEESRVKRLAAYIDRKIGDLANDRSQLGDARLLLMASLMVADELSDAYDENQRLRAALDAQAGNGEGERRAAALIEQVAQQLNAVAAELEKA